MSEDKNNSSQESLINSYWAMKKKHLDDSGAPDLSTESDENLEARQQAGSDGGFMQQPAPQQQAPAAPQRVVPHGQQQAAASQAAPVRSLDSPFGQAPAPQMTAGKGESLAGANSKPEESDEQAAMRIAKELSLLADTPAKPINAPDPRPATNSFPAADPNDPEAVAQRLVAQASLAAVDGADKQQKTAAFAGLMEAAKNNNPGGGARRRSRYNQPVAAETEEGKARMQSLVTAPSAEQGKFARANTPKTGTMQERMEWRMARRDHESKDQIERYQSLSARQEDEPAVIGRSGLGRDVKGKARPRRKTPVNGPMASDALAANSGGGLRSLRMRILPVTIIGAACLFGVKVGSIMLDSGILVPQITESAALAQDATPEDEGAIQPEGVEAQDGALIDPVTGEVLNEAPANPETLSDGRPGGNELFGTGKAIDLENLNKSEIEVLQSLRARREKLFEHEADLKIREKELEAIEQRIDQKIAEMRRIQGTIDTLLEKYDQEKDSQVQSLVKIYETMKPKKAARIFEEMDMEKLLDIAERMKEKKLSPILAVMAPKSARALTEELYNRRRLPDLNRAGGR